MKSELYCRKCKKNKEVKNLIVTTTKNNKKYGKGECFICGSKLWGFLSDEIKSLSSVKKKQSKPTANKSKKQKSISPFISPLEIKNEKKTKKEPYNIEKEIEEWDNVQL